MTEVIAETQTPGKDNARHRCSMVDVGLHKSRQKSRWESICKSFFKPCLSPSEKHFVSLAHQCRIAGQSSQFQIEGLNLSLVLGSGLGESFVLIGKELGGGRGS
jgi:hypothetical protein